MPYKIKILFILLCILLPLKGITQQQFSPENGTKKPRNIILLIGDGMGLSQVSASQFYSNEPSNFDRFTTIGLTKTSALGYLITDSAASATSFATGIKTYNGAIGVDADTLAVKTIIESLSERGMATGLIATSTIQHATPASFYAHVKSRSMYEAITPFLVASEVDFFAGGGRKFFTNRKDGKNLLAALDVQGFEVHTVKLPETLSEKKQAILLSDNAMPKMTEGRGDFLPEVTKLALDYLSDDEDGFFLMVEGSQIDWGGHAKDADYLIAEMLDFDKTIGIALDFARKHGDTLVIVTGDHETGGFTLTIENGDYKKMKPAFASGDHSATMIPVFAEGPGASLLGGIYENTGIYFKMMQLLSD